MLQEEDCSETERKLLELQKVKDSLLVDKSDTINQLTHSLEESQAQCRQLMAANISCENVRLQNQLEDALREKEELSQTVKNLQVIVFQIIDLYNPVFLYLVEGMIKINLNLYKLN